MTNDLHGVLTALSTPFDADENIDFALLRQLVDRSINGGVDTVVEHTAGRVPVVAQTGATTLREAKLLSKAAVESGADVLMLVTPYYEPLTLDETVAYIREVAASVPAPIMLYNIPGATGVNLDVDTVHALATELDNVRYIKDSSADWEQGLRLIRHLRNEIGTFIGWDTYLFSALAEGAAGVMAGAANVVPEEIVEVVRLIRAGDLHGALDKWNVLYPVIDAMISEPFIAAVKAGLRLQNIPVGTPRRPVSDISAQASENIAKALQNIGRC